ncbi:MAG: halocyanin domain-containing protein [Haloarculaceae archaeon]
MSDGRADVSRRAFLRTAAGATTAAAATGAAAAQDSGGGQPDYGGWLSDVGNYDGTTVDKTGESNVTIHVGAQGNGGNLAFDPPAVHVDSGTKITWQWTGQGGSHNVVGDNADFRSGSPVGEEGHTFEHTFDSDGIYKYYCQPHKPLGMKGAIVVGTDYPTTSGGGGGGGSSGGGGGESGGGGGGGGSALPSSAKTLGVATTAVMLGTLGLAYFFIKYGGDYGASE